MKMVDDNTAKGESMFMAAVAGFIALLSLEPFLREQFPNVSSAVSFSFVKSNQVPFLRLCLVITLTISICQWVFRRRLLLTPLGVQHLPWLLYGSDNFAWSDVVSWGSKTVLEQDESNRDYPITFFHIQLKNGRVLDLRGLSTQLLERELDQQVGNRIDIPLDQASL